VKRRAFVGMSTRYYKYLSAMAVLDHAHAKRGGFTRSQNVRSEHTSLNCGFYYHDATSCAEALQLMLERHKEVTGKKVRSDCNVLFEHVVWLSENRYRQLEQAHGPERVRDAFLARLQRYAESLRQEFGFEPLGIEIHFDEGHYSADIQRNHLDEAHHSAIIQRNHLDEVHHSGDERRFIRNIHAHVQFFNYDFSARRAPLRHLMNSGKDPQGRTNALNPHFVRMQDLVAAPFKNLGFERGVSKLITGREHESKESFVIGKLLAAQQAKQALEHERDQLVDQLLTQRVEQRQLAQQIVLQRHEAALWATEIQKLKDQFHHLQQLIKQRAVAAVRQFALRINQLTSSNKPAR